MVFNLEKSVECKLLVLLFPLIFATLGNLVHADIQPVKIFLLEPEAETSTKTATDINTPGGAPSAPNSTQASSESTFFTTPPEGFEDLSGAQNTQVDIYFGNTRVTSAMATFDLTSIEFNDPASIIDKLPRVTHGKIILSAISGPLNPHRENICLKEGVLSCGILSPPVAAVIFNAEHFRADLFINPFYLKTQPIDYQRFLPAPEKHLSSINLFSALISGGSRTDRKTRLNDKSIISYGKTRLLSHTSLQDSEGLILDNARLEYDKRKWTYALGTMNSVGLVSPLVTTQDFLGIRAARTLDLRTDLLLGKSSPIYFFLNERSQVEIYKDAKLVDSRFYEAGNQQLNTSRLPDGTYEITLRIVNSRERKEEKHLFTRSSLLPPENHALHFFEAGSLLKPDQIDSLHRTPQRSDQNFIHLGSRFRLKNNLGGEIEFLNVPSHEDTAQAGLYYFLPNLILHGGLLGGSQQTEGHYLNLGTRFQAFSLNIDYQNLATGQQEHQNDHPLLHPGSKTNLNLGSTVLGGTLLARLTNTDNNHQDPKTEYALKYRRALSRKVHSRLDLTLNWTVNESDETALLGLQYVSTHRSYTQSLGSRWSQSSKGDDIGLQLDGRVTKLHQQDDYLTGKSALFTHMDQDNLNLGMRLERDYQYSGGFLEAQLQHQDEHISTLYSAGAHAIAVTEPSGLTLGGSKTGLAGLIINIEENADDPYEVEINDQVTKTTRHAGKQLILLKPYQQYEVSLKPKGNNLVRFDSSSQKVTLYPGNITQLDWKVSRVFVVVGQAVYPDHSAVQNARITNLKGFSATDENGWFQVELTEMQTLKLKPVHGNACTIELAKISTDEEVIVLDQLPCHPST